MSTDSIQCHANVNHIHILLSVHRNPVQLTSSRAGSVPDWQSPGGVSHQSRDYRTTNLPPRRAVHANRAVPKCQCHPNWATTDTPGLPIRQLYRPAGFSRTTLSVHEFTITYSQTHPDFHRIAPLICLGFHRTAF